MKLYHFHRQHVHGFTYGGGEVDARVKACIVGVALKDIALYLEIMIIGAEVDICSEHHLLLGAWRRGRKGITGSRSGSQAQCQECRCSRGMQRGDHLSIMPKK